MGKIPVIKTLLEAPRIWQAPKGNITAKTLGWIRPDGVINFQTAEAAETYAKNRCISALKAQEPFERGVFVKDNQILAEVKGELTGIKYKPTKDVTGAAFFHGHPSIDGAPTQPLSIHDYMSMINLKLKKISAININGEHSTLTQKPQKSLLKRLLPKKWQDILEVMESIGNGAIAITEYAKRYSKIFPKKYQQTIKQELHSKIGLPFGSKKEIAKCAKAQKITKEELLILQEIENEAMKNGKMARVMNGLWKKTAKKIDCIYETNYSNLMPES